MTILMVGCVAVAIFVLAIVDNGQSALADDMVRVNLSDHQMIIELASALNVDVSQVPSIVVVPIRVAARVCGMKLRELAADEGGELANCDAMRTSSAFRRVVRSQLLVE